MTDFKIRVAANLRIDGRSWEEIGRELSYDPSYIRRAVLGRIQQGKTDCISQQLRRAIVEKFGSLRNFAASIGVTEQYVYRIMSGDAKMSKRLKDAICEATGLSLQELDGE